MRLFLIACLGLLAAIGSLAEANMISATPSDAVHSRNGHSLDSDQCPATSIVALPVTINGNTSGSAHNYSLSCVSSTGGDDIYALSLTCRATVAVSLCGSGYDTAIEARLGPNASDCPGAIVLDCNDDLCGLQSVISFNVDVEQVVFIIVSGFLSHSGPYTMNITATFFPPSNDNCGTVTTITTLPYTEFGSTACATDDYTPSCDFSGAPDVVYQILLPCDIDVTATTCGFAGMDAILYARTGGNCPGNVEVACNDDACANNQSSITFHVLGGFPYYLFVDGYLQSSGLYVLTVTGSGPVAICPGPTIPDTSRYVVSGNTQCTGNNNFPTCVFGGAPQIIYNYTPAVCRSVGLSLCSSYYDTGLQVRTGGACPGDTVVACNDDYCGLQSRLLFNANAGQTYYILVGGFASYSGLFALEMVSTPCGPQHPIHDLVIQLQPNGIFLKWSPLPYADRYNIYRDTSAVFPLDSAHWITWVGGPNDFDVIPDSVSARALYYAVTWATNLPLANSALAEAKERPEIKTPHVPRDLDEFPHYTYVRPEDKQATSKP